VLAVRDTGGGVANELLGRLFEPHFSTTSEGSGLGLAVVHRVAVRAGGSVEAGNVGGGLEVRLLFPAGA
jgi:two-component system sensor histidine kinase HydH